MKSIFPLKTTLKFIMSTEINNQVISMKSKNMAEKAEKLKLKETEKLAKEAAKAEKLRLKKEEDRKKDERQCARFWKQQQKIEDNKIKEAEKLAKETEKAEKLAAKEAEKLASKEVKKLASKEVKKSKKMKKNKEELESTSTVPSSSSEEPFVCFQNVSLIDEINSILNVKKYKNWKKLSAGVKLARQLLDI